MGGSSTSFLGGKRSQKGVGLVFEYAVFDIKPAYNHQISIPDVQLHSTKISVGGQTSDWGS